LASFFPRPELGEEAEAFPHFWQALDRALEGRLSLTTARRYLEGVKRALRRRRRALEALAREQEEAAGWEELQAKADLILARLSDIPRGAARIQVEGFDGAPVSLNLDPALPPAQQAQRLYARARKLRRRLQAIPPRLEELRGEIERLEELRALLESRPELAPYLSGELDALGALPQASGPRRPPRPRPRELVIGGFQVLVGRSARENDELVRRARPHDLWLHARGVPGAHVIVRTDGRPVPERVLRRAAELAAWHSQARGERKVEVSYTEARHVRKPKGAPPGMVTLFREEVVVVSGEEGP
jgi:predicted ribosome quality control (RQC) complex YloA/Tae2 family protein